MFIIRLWQRLMGYVTLRIEGDYCERFLNLASYSGLRFWRVRRRGAQALTLCVARRHRAKVAELCRRSGCTQTQIGAAGLPFIIVTHRSRIGLLCGAAAGIGLCLILSSLVWQVELLGDYVVSESQMRYTLRQMGLYEGAFKSRIDTKNMELTLMQEQNYAYVGINLTGTKATVEFRTREAAESVPNQPSNLVAKFDGQIIRLDVSQGTAVVRRGQMVKSGELIVSGVVQTDKTLPRYVHADATILAQTRHIIIARVPIYQLRPVRGEMVETKKSLLLFNWSIKYWDSGGISGWKCDKITLDTYAEVAGTRLPLGLRTEQYYRMGTELVTLSTEQAQADAQAQCDQVLADTAGDRTVLNSSFSYDISEGVLCATAEYICVEDIGLREPILLRSES